MRFLRKQYLYLIAATVILVGSFAASAIVFALEDDLAQAHNLPFMTTNEIARHDASVDRLEIQSEVVNFPQSLLLDAFGAKVYAQLQAGMLPWDLDLQLTPEQWDAWYHLGRVVEPSILLDTFGPVVYAKLQAGHYPPDLKLPFTNELWEAWYRLDRMGDEDLPLCPQSDLSPESLRRNGIIPSGEGDMRPICLSVPVFMPGGNLNRD